MNPFELFLAALVVGLALIAVVALGLALPARPYPPHDEPSRPGTRLPFAAGLPTPLLRHYRTALAPSAGRDSPAESAPQTATAIAWGRGKLCINGVWLPLRFKTWYRAGSAFFRFTEYTWYGRPVLTGRDSYIAGVARAELGGRVETGLSTEQAHNLQLWAESIWLGGFLALIPGLPTDGSPQPEPVPGEPAPSGESLGTGDDPTAFWQPLDDHTARLVIPLRNPLGVVARDEITLHFDPATGRPTHFSGLRFTGSSAKKKPWRVDLLDWRTINGVLLPAQLATATDESGSPGAYLTLDGVAYNVDVSERLFT
jgi:hypothetical protein